jgi:endonuclease-8
MQPDAWRSLCNILQNDCMPEGPSLVILKEKLSYFKGKKIIAASGYAKIDYSELENKKVIDIKTWGKHLFICLKDTNIEIHLRMFGSYLINERKPKINAKLSLQFAKDELNFYVVDAKLTPDLSVYDWEADIMSDKWNAAKAKKKLKELAEKKICDVLLDQNIFSGVGNIIKNEVLWRAKLYPETLVKDIPAPALTIIMKQVVKFTFEFLKYKKEGGVMKHCDAYGKKECSRCGNKIIKKYLGRTKRASYYCEYCQKA